MRVISPSNCAESAGSSTILGRKLIDPPWKYFKNSLSTLGYNKLDRHVNKAIRLILTSPRCHTTCELRHGNKILKRKKALAAICKCLSDSVDLYCSIQVEYYHYKLFKPTKLAVALKGFTSFLLI